MLGGLDMPAGWVRIDMSVGLFFCICSNCFSFILNTTVIGSASVSGYKIRRTVCDIGKIYKSFFFTRFFIKLAQLCTHIKHIMD